MPKLPKQLDPWTNVVGYVLQDDLHNRLTPRVVDIAYTAFMKAKDTNDEDGGPTDWFTDTKPVVMKAIESIIQDVEKSLSDTVMVYGLVCDYGDGSSGIRWFTDKEEVDSLLNDDEHLEVLLR